MSLPEQAAVPPYPAIVPDNIDDLARAASAARATHDALVTETQRALRVRNDAVCALYSALADQTAARNPSPGEIAALTGLHEGTVRSITRHLKDALDRARAPHHPAATQPRVRPPAGSQTDA